LPENGLREGLHYTPRFGILRITKLEARHGPIAAAFGLAMTTSKKLGANHFVFSLIKSHYECVIANGMKQSHEIVASLRSSHDNFLRNLNVAFFMLLRIINLQFLNS
jgi:hypothetical protein